MKMAITGLTQIARDSKKSPVAPCTLQFGACWCQGWSTSTMKERELSCKISKKQFPYAMNLELESLYLMVSLDVREAHVLALTCGYIHVQSLREDREYLFKRQEVNGAAFELDEQGMMIEMSRF